MDIKEFLQSDNHVLDEINSEISRLQSHIEDAKKDIKQAQINIDTLILMKDKC